MIERLVTKGYVDRRVSETSRRENLVRLTRDGQRLVDEAKHRRRAAIVALMDSFSEDERITIGRAADLLRSRLEEDLLESQVL